MSRKLTYGDFTRTGWQDCGNVFEASEHHETWIRLGKPRGADAAKKVVREAWGDDEEAHEAWLDQADVGEMVEDGLDPRRAYETWRDAWQDCATSAVKRDMKGWIEREEEDHATIARRPSARHAISSAARLSGARPLHWDQRFAKVGDLTVGDVVLSGSVPPYTAYEVIRVETAPRRRLRMTLVRLPDREHQRKSLWYPTDTVAVPVGSRHG